MSRLTYHPLRVLEVIEETADARSVVFEIPSALQASFAYKPGQHLQLHVPCGDKPIPRCYSLSGSPHVPGDPVRVTVKRVADGRASNWLCATLKAGDMLEVAAPAGMFSPKGLDGDFLMFAGGSGITPVYSIVRSVLLSGKGRVRLVYANRDERSVIFGKALAKLSLEHPTRLEVIHWLDSVQGVPSQAQLAGLARGWVHDWNSGAQAFICGPTPFMDAAAAAMKEAGLSHANVHIERFVSLPDDADDEAVSANPAPAGTGDTQVTAELDGVVTQTTCGPGQLLIEALENAGMAPPFSCRSGACAACMCKLDEGEVEMVHNHVLAESDIQAGWILCCQAIPKSPKVKISYPA
ncbi:MAG TPA: ferredoxin--NADP reductase [Verrucomicrobiae bacterium]|nr:ferredoxin--NADP reductase [Verrucomicrobiae bacterium]